MEEQAATVQMGQLMKTSSRTSYCTTPAARDIGWHIGTNSYNCALSIYVHIEIVCNLAMLHKILNSLVATIMLTIAVSGEPAVTL